MIAYLLAVAQESLYMGAVVGAIGACMYPRYALACAGAFLAGGGVRYLAYTLGLWQG